MTEYRWRGLEELSKLQQKVKRAESKLAPAIQDFTLDVGVAWENKSQEIAPRKKGVLAKSLSVDISGGFPRYKLTLKSTAKHFPFVVKGTKPHIIRAKNARALRFSAGGGVVFAKVVHHPGTKPNRFDKKALDAIKPFIKARLVQLRAKILRD